MKLVLYRVVRYAALACLAGLGLMSVSIATYRAAFTETGSKDFQWSPTRLFLHRESPYEVYLSAAERGDLGTPRSPFILSQAADYPATAYVVLAPFGALDWRIAKRLWFVLNLALGALLLVLVFRWARIEGRLRHVVVVGMFLVSTPFRAALGNGQHGFLVLALFMGAFVLAGKRQSLAGVLLGLSWIKFTLSVPLSLCFLSRRGSRVLAHAAMTNLGLWLLAAWWVQSSALALAVDYFQVLLTFPVTGGVDVLGLLLRTGMSVKDIGPVLVISLLLVTGVVATWMRRAGDQLLLSFLAVSSCLIFVHHEYDSIVLVIPLAYVLSRRSLKMCDFLLLACVTCTWYCRAVVRLLGNGLLLSDGNMVLMEGGVFVSNAIVLYGTWIYFVVRAAKHRLSGSSGVSRLAP